MVWLILGHRLILNQSQPLTGRSPFHIEMERIQIPVKMRGAWHHFFFFFSLLVLWSKKEMGKGDSPLFKKYQISHESQVLNVWLVQLMFLRLLSLQAHSREFSRVLSLLLSNIFLWCCVLFVCVCDLFI